MLEIFAKIATLFSIVMFIPMFIEVLLIIKYYHSKNYKTHFGYKLLLFNTFIYSLYLVASIFDFQYFQGFLFLSFLMLPAYFLVLARQFHKRLRKDTAKKVNKEINVKMNTRKRFLARIAREKKRAKAKAMWK